MTEQEINNLIDSKIGKTKMSQLPEATQTSGLYSIGYRGSQSVKFKTNLLQGDPMTVRKTYSTLALANADKNPRDFETNEPLRVGQFIAITGGTGNGIYQLKSLAPDGTPTYEFVSALGDLSAYAKKSEVDDEIAQLESDVINKADSADLFEVNLLDNELSAFYLDRHLSSVNGDLLPNSTTPSIVACRPIIVKKDRQYKVRGAIYIYFGGVPRGSFSETSSFSSSSVIYAAEWAQVDGEWVTTSPVDGYFVVDFELNTNLTALKSPSSIVALLEAGKALWAELLDPVREEFLQEINPVKDELSEIVIHDSHNKINPANIKFDRRYSVANLIIQAASAHLIASSGLIKVTEGEWYCVSGPGIHPLFQGGYFDETKTGAIGDEAIQNISFTNPVSGSGRAFQVPTGLGIKYALVSLATNEEHIALAGDAQLELGEMATPYVPYDPVKHINPDMLPNSPGPTPGGDSALTRYTTFGILKYPNFDDKIPNFRKHFILKDKNLCVVNTGTSLTARSSEHCSLLEDAAFRPPLMHSNNFATHIWNALNWEGQQYRRYDSGYFDELGDWITQSNIAEWDDGPYRAGLTRYSDDASSKIDFTVPEEAWQFNLIYRSDSTGSENCVLNIAEGNGKMEVLNSSNVWVEANGFIFSQKESPISSIAINYINPVTGAPATSSSYQTKGNTTYQKRLYLRCKSGTINSIGEVKNISISRTSGRLLYWGVEWSNREYMITYINAARGSHSSAITGASLALNHYQDNEIWSFKPDLIFTEDAIHNAGGAGVPNNAYPHEYYGRVSDNFFFAENDISMKARCQALGLNLPEFVIFNSSITWNFKGINEDGSLKSGPTLDGLIWTALDSQSSCYLKIKENYPNIIYVNAVKEFVKAGFAAHGNMRAATIGSGKIGNTFTNEGSHWNDTGSKVMARILLPILDFVI